MQGRFSPDVFQGRGLSLVLPRPDEQAYLHEAYVTELLRDRFLDETRQRVLAIVARLAADDGVEAVVLGGTELPLLLPRESAGSTPVPLLDTTVIHAHEIAAELARLDGERDRPTSSIPEGPPRPASAPPE
jgi:aspartate racemase